ncbi:MAG: Rieske 2Fe-2S domain-containing protein [Litorilinea sp.]
MAETMSELSGDAREQRIAELKAKMQAAAARAKANQEATGSPAGESVSEPAAAAEPAPVAEAVAESAPAADASARPAVAPAKPAPRPAGNGATAPRPAPAAARPAPKAAEKADSGAPTVSEMNRREFMIYAWGAALGLLTLEVGVLSYLFMYPRFRAGEFGGQFFVPESTVPASDSPPDGNPVGKFWMVSNEEGEPKALYMVCTHLGCLYKWEPSAFRFECPCHGSKFTKDGYFIEGPAPRSLDYFEVSVEGETIIVDTGRRITGDPATESPARIIEA